MSESRHERYTELVSRLYYTRRQAERSLQDLSVLNTAHFKVSTDVFLALNRPPITRRLWDMGGLGSAFGIPILADESLRADSIRLTLEFDG